MAKKTFGPHIVSANDLLTGAVVVWTGSSWSTDAHAARVYLEPDEQQRALALAEADSNRVVGAYLVAVAAQPGRAAPVRLREQIRVAGPTVRLDLGNQAGTDRQHVREVA